MKVGGGVMQDDRERALYFEKQAELYQSEARYYQEELVKAHALLGRVVHQLSERWDTVNLTKYYPTDNLHHRRTVGNPKGETPTQPDGKPDA